MSLLNMKKEIFKYIKDYSTETRPINRLLVSSFVLKNNLKYIKNKFLKEFIIEETIGKEFDCLMGFLSLVSTNFNIEDLIELFEFVISPSDKIVNGAVYTPKYIREYIVKECLKQTNKSISKIKAGDISCGCGGFLLTVASNIQKKTKKSFKDIFIENIYGIDITGYSILRAKILLTIFALLNGEDEEFEFNLKIGDSLAYSWAEASLDVSKNKGFDIIVGNPPYVASRNMDLNTLALLSNWEVTKSGHPDLYIPFFQIGFENLNKKGILGFITVNTFIKSINGRALREYFANMNINLSILSFGGEQVFQARNTYTCICFLKQGNGQINFIRTKSNEIVNLDLKTLNQFNYNDLNHHDGWNLVNDQPLVDFINKIENTGLPFKNLYETKNGIATLKNNVYKFKPDHSDEEFYYLNDQKSLFPIEIGICKKIINANKLKTVADIDRLAEQIIFPYDEQTKIISEHVMKANYPKAYAYLQTKKEVLAKRDKGQGEYEAWYAYGRRQSMDIHAYKLFFPHICERPKFVICEEMDLLFYNGISIVSSDLEELKVIKRVMESEVFFKYISNSTKDYASGYISMSRNYLKNFGVYQFSKAQKKTLLYEDNVEGFLEKIYGI